MAEHENIISEEMKHYFMGIAAFTAKSLSKDPRTQVGVCIVDPNTNNILSTGSNHFPKGCCDYKWTTNKNDYKEYKHYYVVHAEKHAILNSNLSQLKGSTMFVTLHPCCYCAQSIIECGIKEVYYLTDKEKKDEFLASKRMLKDANVHCEPFTPNRSFKINFDTFKDKKIPI